MNVQVKADATTDAYDTPLEKLNPARADRFQANTFWPVFERLRREDPVHFTAQSEFGPYWSITRWADIMAVDTNNEAFSSADGIALANLEAIAEQEKIMGQRRRGGAGFITMDEPGTCRAGRRSPDGRAPNVAKMAPLCANVQVRFSTACRSARNSTGSISSRRSSPR